jgi:hypothetical protein
MYVVAIGWMYVALMMTVAEATHPTGTLLGAFITFVLYGVCPVALVLYLMGTPARRKAIKAREQAELLCEHSAKPAVLPALPAGDGTGNPNDQGKPVPATPNTSICSSGERSQR